MKRKITILVFSIALTGMIGLVAGCSTIEQDPLGPVEAGAIGAPALQPVDHEGRFERSGASSCYGCHGNGSLANPQLTGAPLIPEDHYVEASYDTKEIDPNRDQCLTCHPVGE